MTFAWDSVGVTDPRGGLVWDGSSIVLVDAYDPNQPRAPKGGPDGGQWTSEGGGVGGNADEPRRPSYEEARQRWERGGVFLGRNPSETVAQLENTGIDPEAFYRDMTGGRGGNLKAETTDDGLLAVAGVKPGVGGKPQYLFSRHIDLEDGSVAHSYFEVADTHQGAGIARDILRGQIDAYLSMGLNRVDLNANLEVGGYAWAKYGFVPREGDWNHIRRTVSNDSVMQDLTREQYGAVDAILNDPDPRSLWALSDASFSGPGFQHFGKHVLVGNSWDGSLDLHDERAMTRFRAYTGRRAVRDYDPNQPRAPAGTSEGGQWTSSGSSGRSYNEQGYIIANTVEEYRELERARRETAEQHRESNPLLAEFYRRAAEHYGKEAEDLESGDQIAAYEMNEPNEDAGYEQSDYLSDLQRRAEESRDRAAEYTQRADSGDGQTTRGRQLLEAAIDEEVSKADRLERMVENVMNNPWSAADWDGAGVVTRNRPDVAARLNAMGMSPDEFNQYMTGGRDMRLDVGMGLNDRLIVRGSSSDGAFMRSIDAVGGVVYNDQFEVTSDVRGAGIAKDILGGQVEAWRRSGVVDKMSVYANLSVGGYAWAKYGYVPTQSSWDSIRQSAGSVFDFENRWPEVAPGVRSILGSSDPKSIWALSDVPEVGKTVLLGRGWDGALDLRDQEQMTRFNAYVSQPRGSTTVRRYR